MILFTADWHIKLGQKNVPTSWAIDRYNMFLDQLSAIEPRCTLHIVGGDLFDRLPTMEELALYFDFVSRASITTLIFDGNHEATRKNATFFSHLKEATSRINNKVFIIDEPTTELRFSILPYCYLHRKGWIEKMPKDKPLFTHVRGEIPPHVKPEVDLDRFEGFPVVFAGDLHAHSNTQKNIVYPGSPMTTSFHRNHVSTGYLLIDENNFHWKWESFDLPQLIRKTVQDPKDMIPTDFDHTIYELEGDISNLAEVENSELLDKKIIRRNSEASLILDKDLSKEEELIEYLLYIEGLPEEEVKEVISVFREYAIGEVD